jgi:ubiquinone/menaquinone biosynthesis C-methylase UbiE/uncharacterized protein YbaR (Trm112 family)
MPESRSLLVCPTCRSDLLWLETEVRCTSCSRRYPVRAGIVELLADVDAHKAAQATFHDEEADNAYEISRPHDTPRFYRFLLEEKYRRGLSALGSLSSMTALTVCGGSGMDADFLARAGARVLTVDISARAAERARERARQYNLEIESVVADVERLPFRDRSVDLVFVHDGLHHLVDPFLGIEEIARVARLAVSVNEPSKAVITRVAVRIGLALEQEDAGNRVARLDLAEVVRSFVQSGFSVVHAERFPMLYRHKPGMISRALSRPLLFEPAKAAYLFATILAGRAGNKLTVQAIRRSPCTDSGGSLSEPTASA